MYLVDNYKMTDERINAFNALFLLTWNVGSIRYRRNFNRLVQSLLILPLSLVFLLLLPSLIRSKYL